MTTITNFMVTDYFLNNYSTQNWELANAKIGVKLFTRAPNVSDRSYNNFKLIEILSDLNNHPEWVEIKSSVVAKSAGIETDLYLEKDTQDGDEFFRITLSNEPNTPTETANIDDLEKTGWYIEPLINYSQEIVVCAVFYVNDSWYYGEQEYFNPVIAVSTQGIGNRTVVQNGTVFGQNATTADGKQHLFKIDSKGDFYAGYIYMKPAPPIWENAHAQHIWIEPQRINYIANPSFEGGMFGWRCSVNAAMETIGDPGTKCLHVTRSYGTDRVILESNFFPRDSKWLSMSFKVKGNGTVRFGVVNFDSSYYEGVYLRSDDRSITNTGFYKFTALIPNTDFSTEALFRIEVDAGEFWVDDVLVDPHESQYEYFDGSSTDGLPGDFRWANGETSQQFSVWYNNYSNTSTRLVGQWDYEDINEGIHPYGVYKTGLVDEWIPTGANVIVHWDAVSSFTPSNWLGNAYYQLSDVHGTPVTDITTLTELDFNRKSY